MLANRRERPLASNGGRVAVIAVCLLSGVRALGQQPPFPDPSQPGFQPSAAAAAPAAPTQTELVADVRVIGNETIDTNKILNYLKTRKDRQFDPELVQADKRRLAATGMFRDVRIFTERAANGMVVTFEVFERPTLRYVEFVGNRGLSDKALKKEAGVEVGDALNVYTVEEARRKIEDLYRTKGYPQAQVVVTEGTAAGDRGAVFYISEGPLQRVESVEFIGNEIATDARLKTKIQSKPGFLWYLFRGKVDEGKIDEDVERLTAYYRGLGFFRARISRVLDYDESREWLKLTFVIDEGPRYLIRNVSLAGNTRFGTPDLDSSLNLRSGEYFNLDKMNADVNTLRDIYGSQGYIFADIKADPRFLEEPGQLDLMYSIDEGDQFSVGRINVHIAGEFPHTRENVILDRLSIRPGDIVDIREVRASERRLKSSQLFVVNPAEGEPPKIVVRPPSLSEVEAIAREDSRRGIRGQSPDGPEELGPKQRPVIVDVFTPPLRRDSDVEASESQEPKP